MSATNATATISLPLFIGTDKPAWLTDWNGAMNTIDSAIATLQTAEAGTATSLASLSQSVTALSSTVEQHTTAIQTVTDATATNTGSINTINSLIGNGTPTTTDQTIIGAINEINAAKGDLSDLDTTVKTSLVGAINEIEGKSVHIIDYVTQTTNETASSMLDRLYAAALSGTQLGDYNLLEVRLIEDSLVTDIVVNSSNFGAGNVFRGSKLAFRDDMSLAVLGINVKASGSQLISYDGTTSSDSSSVTIYRRIELIGITH